MNEIFNRELTDTVTRAIAEDVGQGDLTASLVSKDAWRKATVVSREEAVLCGRAWVEEVFNQLGGGVALHWLATDGDNLALETPFLTLEGPAKTILTGERTALNFLQLLSAVATVSRRYAEAVAGTGAVVLDTRKTIPGLRFAQKYAVKCGGCANHRMGLYDAILIKENHIASAGSISQAVSQARTLHPGVKVEVEVESLDELSQALEAKANSALLDNFSLEMMREAVSMVAGKIALEASGNVSLEQVREIALTGVDYISVGALTKHVRAIDLSMRFV